MDRVYFEWDEDKDKENQNKHGVPFTVRFTYRANRILIIGAIPTSL